MSTLDDAFPEFPTSIPGREPIAQETPSVPPADPAPQSAPAEPAAEPAVIPDAAAQPDDQASGPASAPSPETTPTASGTEESVPAAEVTIDTAHEDPIPAAPDENPAKDIPASDARVQKEIVSTPQLREAALRARMERREQKLQRIVESARNRGSITNEDIERLLHVSDKSATRYANMLVARGELLRTGKARAIRYTPRT